MIAKLKRMNRDIRSKLDGQTDQVCMNCNVITISKLQRHTTRGCPDIHGRDPETFLLVNEKFVVIFA